MISFAVIDYILLLQFGRIGHKSPMSRPEYLPRVFLPRIIELKLGQPTRWLTTIVFPVAAWIVRELT